MSSAEQVGLPDFTFPVAIVAQMIASLKVDIAAQSIGNLKVDIAAQSVESISVSIAAASVTLPVSIQSSVVNVPVEIKASSVTVPISIQSSAVNVPIDIKASSVTLPVSIQSSAITLNVAIAASAINVPVEIRASAVTLNVNIASATTLNVNIAASSVTLNVNMQQVNEPTVSAPALLKLGTQVVRSASVSGPGVTTFYTVPSGRVAYVVYLAVSSATSTIGGYGSAIIAVLSGTTYTILKAAPDTTATGSGTVLRMNAGDRLQCVADTGQLAECTAVIAETTA